MNIVTEITVKRLFNLGDFEHESIEVKIQKPFSIETENGITTGHDPIENPVETLQRTREALNACKGVEKGYMEETGLGIESGTFAKENYNEAQLAEFALAVDQYRANLALREKQIAFLDTLGAVTRKGVEK